MAPKRVPNPPPSSLSASGSEEEDDETSSSPPSLQPKEKPSLKKPKPTPQHDSIPKSPREPSDGDDEESSDDEEDAHRFNIKPSQPKEQPKSDSGSSESDSDSDSEPDPSPKKPATHRPAVPNVKPINSKPLDDKPKRPAPSKHAATASPQKRLDEPVKDEKDSKRRRKAGLNASADEPTKKQQGFTRLWSEEDEIAVLKGVAEYIKKGSNLAADKEGFHSFVKDSLHVEVSTTQLSDKITRLKKKYQTNLKRATKGKEPDFAKPHEKTAFDLSKKIWGGNMVGEDDDIGAEANGGDSVLVNAKAGGAIGGDLVQVKAEASGSRSRKTTAKAATPAKVLAIPENPEIVNGEAQIESLYPHLSRNLNLLAYDESILKKGLNLVEPSKVKVLEDRWKKIELMEMDIYKRRIALIEDVIDLTFDSLEQSVI